MSGKKKWVESKAKERTSENLIRTMLEFSGYKVMNFGMEHHNMEVIRSMKDNYDTSTNRRLHSMPDLVVVDPDTGKATLVEIKYRTVNQWFDLDNDKFLFKWNRIENYIEFWKDSALVLTFDRAPYVYCVLLSEVDEKKHCKGKVQTGMDRFHKHWSFSDIFKKIEELFPKVNEENFNKSLEIVGFNRKVDKL